MWSELLSRPTPLILIGLIGAAFILCLWAFLSQRRITRASAGDETASLPSPAIVSPRAPEPPTTIIPARDVTVSRSAEIRTPPPVPCALAVAATLAAVEAKRAAAIRK